MTHTEQPPYVAPANVSKIICMLGDQMGRRDGYDVICSTALQGDTLSETIRSIDQAADTINAINLAAAPLGREFRNIRKLRGQSVAHLPTLRQSTPCASPHDEVRFRRATLDVNNLMKRAEDGDDITGLTFGTDEGFTPGQRLTAATLHVAGRFIALQLGPVPELSPNPGQDTIESGLPALVTGALLEAPYTPGADPDLRKSEFTIACHQLGLYAVGGYVDPLITREAEA